jgi:hypothetical protein
VITEQADVAWIDGARTVAMRRGTIEPIRTAVGGPS